MIGYVQNITDRTWKPILSSDDFYALVESEHVAHLTKQIRTSQDSDQQDILKRQLPAFIFMGQTIDGRPGDRKKNNLISNNLAMLDFDQAEGEAEHLFQLFQATTDREIFLAHRTPKGHGLRVVTPILGDETIEDVQRQCANAMGVKIDTACKDISRLSFAVPHSDIFCAALDKLLSYPVSGA